MDKTTERLTRLLREAQADYAKDYWVIAIPGFLSKKYIGYCSMKEDLERTLKYINFLRIDSDRTIKSALTYSLISLYGKCFTDASKNNYPKLEASKLFSESSEDLETHNFIIELRHQFIAHRGKTESEVGIAYLIFPKIETFEKSQVRFSQLKQISFSEDDLDKIEKLIKFLIEKIKDKIQIHGQKIYEAMFNLFTPEQIILMAINNAK